MSVETTVNKSTTTPSGDYPAWQIRIRQEQKKRDEREAVRRAEELEKRRAEATERVARQTGDLLKLLNALGIKSVTFHNVRIPPTGEFDPHMRPYAQIDNFRIYAPIKAVFDPVGPVAITFEDTKKYSPQEIETIEKDRFVTWLNERTLTGAAFRIEWIPSPEDAADFDAALEWREWIDLSRSIDKYTTTPRYNATASGKPSPISDVLPYFADMLDELTREANELLSEYRKHLADQQSHEAQEHAASEARVDALQDIEEHGGAHYEELLGLCFGDEGEAEAVALATIRALQAAGYTITPPANTNTEAA